MSSLPHVTACELESSPTEIIADLIIQKDECGVMQMDREYYWVRQAVLHLRKAYAAGERMNALAATCCQSWHPRYEAVNQRLGIGGDGMCQGVER